MDDYTITFNNYIKGLHLFGSDSINEALTNLSDILDPDNNSYHVATLGEFYFHKYIKEVLKVSNKTIEKANKIITESDLIEIEKERIQFNIELLNTRIEQVTSKPKDFSFKNNFDNINEKIVYNHFHQGLVETKLLDVDTLKDYIKAAFEYQKAPKNRFHFERSPAKKIILKVFYHYYLNVAGKPKGLQPEYAALLGDYFNGWNTKTLLTNFSKIY